MSNSSFHTLLGKKVKNMAWRCYSQQFRLYSKVSGVVWVQWYLWQQGENANRLSAKDSGPLRNSPDFSKWTVCSRLKEHEKTIWDSQLELNIKICQRYKATSWSEERETASLHLKSKRRWKLFPFVWHIKELMKMKLPSKPASQFAVQFTLTKSFSIW